MSTLLGFQLADLSGVNIQGDDTDPLRLASFEIMSPTYAVQAISKLGADRKYLLMPIFEGDVEDPTILQNKSAVIPEDGNVTAALLDVLRTIQSWPANNNSDPDVMGNALDAISRLAANAIRDAEAILSAWKIGRANRRIIARFVPHGDFSTYGELTNGAVEIDVTDQILAMPRGEALLLKDGTDTTDQLAYDFKNEIGHSGPFHVEVEQAIRSYFSIPAKPSQLTETLLLAYRISLGGSVSDEERQALDSALLSTFGAPYSSVMASRWPQGIDLDLIAGKTPEPVAAVDPAPSNADPELREYLVSWSIDMDAASPEAAAERTRQILTDPENTAWHFSVTDKATDIVHEVNLPDSPTGP